MKVEFFIPLSKVPTATGQEKGYSRRTGTYYEPQRLKETRNTLMVNLYRHVPEERFEGPVALTVMWAFTAKSHKPGTWKTTKPDTDNLQKVLKDCMTRLGFWNDDAQVCVETVSKMWSDVSGIAITIQELSKNVDDLQEVTKQHGNEL